MVGYAENDPHHKGHNNHIVALGQAELSWAKLEVAVTLFVAGAPFGKSAFHHTLAGALDEFFESLTPDCELIQAMYWKLAGHRHEGLLPMDFGAVAHQQSTWEWSRCCPHFVSNGSGGEARPLVPDDRPVDGVAGALGADRAHWDLHGSG